MTILLSATALDNIPAPHYFTYSFIVGGSIRCLQSTDSALGISQMPRMLVMFLKQENPPALTPQSNTSFCPCF